MEIRNLTNDDMPLAMELKISCWTEELAEKAENTLKLESEYQLSGKLLVDIFEFDILALKVQY